MLKLSSSDLTATNVSEKIAASFFRNCHHHISNYTPPTPKDGSYIVQGHEKLRSLNIYKWFWLMHFSHAGWRLKWEKSNKMDL
jgi:hypothetical protein